MITPSDAARKADRRPAIIALAMSAGLVAVPLIGTLDRGTDTRRADAGGTSAGYAPPADGAQADGQAPNNR